MKRKATTLSMIIWLMGLIFVSSIDASQVKYPNFPLPDQLNYQPLKFSFPPAQKKVLSNGISLHIVEDHDLPLIKITVLVKVGNADDPLGKEGLAELTSMVMISGGTRSMSGDDVDEAMAFMAADFYVTTNLEYTLFTLSVLKQDLEKSLKILSQILKEPGFEQKKLEISKDLKIEELKRLSDNPSDLAFRHYRKLLYRRDPRGRLSTPSTIEKIGRQDLVIFHESFFSPENILIALSGDVRSNEAIESLNRLFGSWRKKPVLRKNLPPPAGEEAFSLSLLPKETPQSIIIYGHLAPAVNNQDFYPFTVLDFILGSGGFRSRMFQEIRTKHGLSYSSGSFYVGRRDYGVFESYAITKAGSTSRVLGLMKDIIQKLQAEQIKAEDLQWAKNAIQNNFIFSFKTPDDVAIQQMMLEYQNMPLNFLETFREKISTVKAEDVRRMALKYLDLNKATILVVGPEKEFDSPLSQFGHVVREELSD